MRGSDPVAGKLCVKGRFGFEFVQIGRQGEGQDGSFVGAPLCKVVT